MRNSCSLTEGKVWRVLLRFSIPFLLANFLQALYGAVDLMVVGAYCSAESIAAVSTGTQVTQIVTSLISGLTLGGTVLVAKYVGKGRQEKVEQAVRTTVAAFGVFSLFLTLALAAGAGGILRLLQIPEGSYEEAWQYILICCGGVFFLCEYNALSAVLRGYGDSLSPLLFAAVACVCNVAGDFFTVGYLHMGAAGTAVATVVSQGVSMGIALLYLNSRTPLFRFSLRGLKPDRGILKELAAVGVPVSLQECAVRFSFLYLTAVINGFGVYAASAVGIAGKYDVFAMLPATSLANALTALTAQNMAAGKEGRAQKFLKYGMLLSLACSSLFFAWAQLAPQTMLGVFTPEPEVVRAGIPFLRSCSLDYLAVAFLFCLNGFLNGREKTVFTMVNCCCGALLVRVPALYLLYRLGVESLFLYGLVSPVSSVLMLLVICLYLAVQRRRAPGTAAEEAARDSSAASSGRISDAPA